MVCVFMCECVCFFLLLLLLASEFYLRWLFTFIMHKHNLIIDIVRCRFLSQHSHSQSNIHTIMSNVIKATESDVVVSSSVWCVLVNAHHLWIPGSSAAVTFFRCLVTKMPTLFLLNSFVHFPCCPWLHHSIYGLWSSLWKYFIIIFDRSWGNWCE